MMNQNLIKSVETGDTIGSVRLDPQNKLAVFDFEGVTKPKYSGVIGIIVQNFSLDIQKNIFWNESTQTIKNISKEDFFYLKQKMFADNGILIEFK